MLLHAFNFHDPSIQLRIGAIAALLGMIFSLALVELLPRKSKRFYFGLVVLFFIGSVIVAYALVTLKGA